MKKLLVISALIITPVITFAFNPMVFNGERSITVNATTGRLYTIQDNGYVNIFAHAKTYFNLDEDGVTPNTSSKYIAAGGSINTGHYMFAGEKLGLLSDSGTASVNITSSDVIRRVR